jgi:ankyrin repeat domain-containing protein 50
MNYLHRTLHSLPKTLDETYDRILHKVNEDNQPLVRHILQCVCFFSRPISVEEVRHICRIGDHGVPPFDSEDALFDQKDVIDLCGGLLCLVFVHSWQAARGFGSFWYSYDQETVQLAHFSVKEYLLSTRAMSWRLDEELSHLYIVKAGIAYYLEFMASGDITSPGASVEVFHRNHPLAVYCASFMADHLSHLDPRDHPDFTESFQYLLDPMLQPSIDRKIGLLYFLDISNPPPVLSDPDKAEPLEVSTLRIAARLGLPMICQWLLSINTLAQISSTVTEPGVGSSFLTYAAWYGHAGVLNVLLKAGADINKAWGGYRAPLHAAALNGHRECVEILINSGADVNMKGNSGTAVDLAMQRGHEGIVKILRDAGGRSWRELEACT